MVEIPPKTDILNLTRDALVDWLADQGEARFRADQIRRWLFQRRADRFEAMTDLSKALRERLDRHFSIGRLAIVDHRQSTDGSRKFLFRLRDGRLIESVLIPEADHNTLCISCQVGCAQGCRFCLTGTAGLERNLTPGEILGQVIETRRQVEAPDRLTNIVFMGMGEPLANYGPVVAAIATLCDAASGLGFSARRVTLSTVGLVPRLADLGRDTRVNLAISLNAADDPTRTRLMPINRTYPISALIDACRAFPLAPRRRITFEYILIQGVNDRPGDAHKLAGLLAPVRAKVNLIPFNAHEGCDFRRPDAKTIERFQRILVEKRYTAVIRHSKGLDIKAACGQLKATAVSLLPQDSEGASDHGVLDVDRRDR